MSNVTFDVNLLWWYLFKKPDRFWNKKKIFKFNIYSSLKLKEKYKKQAFAKNKNKTKKNDESLYLSVHALFNLSQHSELKTKFCYFSLNYEHQSHLPSSPCRNIHDYMLLQIYVDSTRKEIIFLVL